MRTPLPAPDLGSFRRDVLRGLAQARKEIPCKYFYDARGSELFERICELPEYYLTRAELSITEARAGEIAELLGPRCLLVEFGSGSSRKTRILLERLREPAAYVPVDISRAALHGAAAALARAFPGLEVAPLCADYTAGFELPGLWSLPQRRVVYFPGSTIGNFHPSQAQLFLKSIAALCGRGGALLIGVDLQKSTRVLEAAYDDAGGVTAEFNLNLLARANRELGADFRLERFRHRAFYEPINGRIEMHLVSTRAQAVHIGEIEIPFAPGEMIWTESSYKYTLAGFRELAGAAGFEVRRVWTDPAQLFSVQFLVPA